MATKINAADVNVMTFNAHDVYDEEALAERLNDIADVLDKMREDEILVVFNDVPELTYEVWDRYKVGYHDYDVHQYEIGLKK